MVLSYLKKSNATTIPLVWLHPPLINEFYIQNIMKNKYIVINPVFLKEFYRKLGLEIEYNFLDKDLFYKFNSYDNNLHINCILENIIYSKILTNEKFNEIKIGGLDVFKTSKDFEEYKRLSGVTLLFVTYPGYEINLECKYYNKIIYLLYNDNNLTSELLEIIKKSTTLHKYIIDFFLEEIKRKTFISTDWLSNIYKNIKDDDKKDYSYASSLLSNTTSKSLATKGIVFNRKYYKHYYQAAYLYVEYFMHKFLENKKFTNFDILKVYGIDINNKILEMEVIDMNKYSDISTNIKNNNDMIKEIKNIIQCINEYYEKSKSNDYEIFSKENQNSNQIINQILLTLKNATFSSDYTYQIDNILRYVNRSIDKKYKYNSYYINGDLSIDHFYDNINKKFLIHDWNGAKKLCYEAEIAIFISNIYFHIKNKTYFDIVVDFSELKQTLINNLKFNEVDIEIFKLFLVYSLVIKGLIISSNDIISINSIDDIFDKLQKLYI